MDCLSLVWLVWKLNPCSNWSIYSSQRERENGPGNCCCCCCCKIHRSKTTIHQTWPVKFTMEGLVACRVLLEQYGSFLGSVNVCSTIWQSDESTKNEVIADAPTYPEFVNEPSKNLSLPRQSLPNPNRKMNSKERMPSLGRFIKHSLTHETPSLETSMLEMSRPRSICWPLVSSNGLWFEQMYPSSLVRLVWPIEILLQMIHLSINQPTPAIPLRERLSIGKVAQHWANWVN